MNPIRTLLLTATLLMSASPTMLAVNRVAGGDISLLTKYETNGAKFRDTDGTTISNMLTYFADNNWTAMRVRLFVDPTQASTTEQGEGVCQDLEYVKALGARIKAAGFKFLLDFHYSDSWADPVKQYTPASWATLTDEQLVTQIYDYTYNCLTELVAAGATPDYIQTGNEISYGMLWGPVGTSTSNLKRSSSNSDTYWPRFAQLLASAGSACRAVCPDAKIVIQNERIAKPTMLKNFYSSLASSGIDYDIIGLSYYPYFHGDLTQLETDLSMLESNFPTKEIMIVEAGYYHVYQPDNIDYDLSATYPISDEGQNAFITALVEKLEQHSKVTGLFWWWPEACEYGLDWNTKRVTDSWYNAGLWDNATGKAMQGVATVGTFSYTEETPDTPDTPDNTEIYILGEVNGNAWATNVGVQMATDDHITYTATITTTGEWDGYSYFGLTTALADTADDWDGIAANRFGPVSDSSNFLVTEALLGQNITLTTDAYASFQIPAGTYNISLNLTNMTIVITAVDDPTPTFHPCDVNKDGSVDTTDLTLVINAILEL